MGTRSRQRRTANRAAARQAQQTSTDTESSTADADIESGHVYRGFGPDPKLIDSGGEQVAITRSDVLELPAILDANPFIGPRDRLKPGSTEQREVSEKLTVESAASLMLEYMASSGPRVALQFGSPYGLSQGVGIHILPMYIDELERDFGVDMYPRMMLDAVVSAKMETMIDGILDKPIVVSPGYEAEGDEQTDADKKQIEFATEVADFCKYNTDNLRDGFMLVIREMLEGIWMGYKLAEQVYELWELGKRFPGIKGKATCLASLNPKPQEATSIVVDQYNTVLGYLPRLRGAGLLGSFLYADLGVRSIEDKDNHVANIPDMVSPEKIARFTWMPRNDSPVGMSHLRPAYIPWRLKIGLYPAYEAYLARFAQPSVGLELGGQEIPAMAGPGGATLTNPAAITQALLTNLLNWQAGGAVVAPVGVLRMLEASGNGEAYTKAFELVDSQITLSILHTNLSTDVGEYGTKGLGEVHQDTGNQLFQIGKLVTANFVREQILRPLVFYNYGYEGLAVLPKVSFGEATAADEAEVGAMIASLMTAGLLFPPQYNDIFKMLHLQELEPEVIDLLIEQWMTQLQQSVDMMNQQSQMAAQGQMGPDGQPLMPGQQPDPNSPGAALSGPTSPGAGGGGPTPAGGAAKPAGSAKPSKPDANYYGG